MSDLLELVTAARGGLNPWLNAQSVHAMVDIHGDLWEMRGQGDLLGACEVTVRLNEQHVTIQSLMSGRTIVFDGPANQVTVSAGDSDDVEVLHRPRESMTGPNRPETWSPGQAGYFVGYGLWSYLLEPLLLHRPDVVTREIEPWHELGETWRRLEVEFPSELVTHQATYVYYFDSRTGLQRRMDYAPEVLGGRPAAHYTYEHRYFDQVSVPSARRVLRRDQDGRADHNHSLILLDITGFRIT